MKVTLKGVAKKVGAPSRNEKKQGAQKTAKKLRAITIETDTLPIGKKQWDLFWKKGM